MAWQKNLIRSKLSIEHLIRLSSERAVGDESHRGGELFCASPQMTMGETLGNILRVAFWVGSAVGSAYVVITVVYGLFVKPEIEKRIEVEKEKERIEKENEQLQQAIDKLTKANQSLVTEIDELKDKQDYALDMEDKAKKERDTWKKRHTELAEFLGRRHTSSKK